MPGPSALSEYFARNYRRLLVCVSVSGEQEDEERHVEEDEARASRTSIENSRGETVNSSNNEALQQPQHEHREGIFNSRQLFQFMEWIS